jgi:hypothetical protein
MARYLPRDYDPIPDALLRSKADLIDVTRRIARNQNWIWANHGNVLAATGQEPLTTQTPSVTTGTIDVAYFACPNRTATGSDSVRCCGYVTVVTGSANAKLRLYQLMPGENTPTADTPYDEVALSSAGTDVFVDFNARIRSGADPLRFCLRLIGASSGTYTLLSTTVTWVRNPSSVLGETVEAWAAMSQGFCIADRAMSAALVRALSNRTLRLMAENPRPIYSHSFIWPRVSTAAAGTETRVALYSAKHDGITSPSLGYRARAVVTGNGSLVTFRLYVNGTLKDSQFGVGPGTTTNGVYITETSLPFVSASVPTGDLKIEITAQCTAGATAPPTYCTNVGAVFTGMTIFQGIRSGAQLGLPGADTVPAAYQPIDESACVPGRSVVAQNDRLGRRAGPFYLVKNLIWLAANRTAHVLVADWLHRTTAAAWVEMGTAAFAGDGIYRNQTLYSDIVQALPTWWFENAPQSLDYVPWSDRAAPTNAWNIKDNGPVGAAGHHYIGDVLGRFYCQPMNGGQIAAILRPDLLYGPRFDANGLPVPRGEEHLDLEFYFASTRDHRVPMGRKSLSGGFKAVAPGTVKPSAATLLSLRANSGTYGDIGALGGMQGVQGALHSAYIYEAPLTQTDLDALA